MIKIIFFRKIKILTPPNFWTPLKFSALIDLVNLHPCTKFGNSRYTEVGARGHKAVK